MPHRRQDIDATKGLAILLVVFGHLVARADPHGVGWYEPLRRAIYAFHMPLFLYLSGLVAVSSGMLLSPRAAWGRVAQARVKRLLLPFFGLGLLVVLGKLLAARVMYVDNPPAGLAAGLLGLVWHTAASPALSIWYLFVLFVVSLGAMVLLGGRPARWPLLLGLSLLLYVLPLPAYMYADRVGEYAVFFMLGTGAGFAGARWDGLVDRIWPAALVLLLLALTAVALFDAQWPEKWVLLPVGALSLPAIHGALRNMSATSLQALFLVLGRYGFMIYLFNTLFIGFTKGLLLHVCSWDGANFLPFACVLMTAGILGPMGLKRYALRRVPALDRFTN
ncbi:MAG: acyltransferase family protein [Acidocella sp.]|nr:acyltransferase family protein [Acidocella sp.]